jgi:hypothetical protein
MITIKKLSGVIAAILISAASVQAGGHTYVLNNVASGNWNSKNQRTANSYLIGYNAKFPNQSGAYFEYNFAPAKGKTVTGCSLLIAGSTDYNIESYWANPDEGVTNNIEFKVGCAPQSSTGYPFTLAQITTGNNIANLAVDCCNDANRNPDLGYVWVPDGLHKGKVFDAFHYESTGAVGPYIQNAVNAGGDYVIWCCDRVNSEKNGTTCPVNYIWGSTGFLASNTCTITTSN